MQKTVLARSLKRAILAAKKAKSKYKKGDRVVVNRGNDGIFIGTVTSCGGGGKLVYFTLDNGDSDSLSARSKHIMGKSKRTSTCRKPIAESDLHRWLDS